MCFTILKLCIKHYYVSKGRTPPNDEVQSMLALGCYIFCLFVLVSLSLILSIQVYSERESIPAWVPILPIIGLMFMLIVGASELLILLICKDADNIFENDRKKTDSAGSSYVSRCYAGSKNVIDKILTKFVAKENQTTFTDL